MLKWRMWTLGGNMSLENLKQQFDRVALKHIMEEDTPRTIAVLSKGNERFVGISYCHDNDQFNRRRGREIAINRALHQYKVFAGEKLARNPENYRVQALLDSPNSLTFNINDVPGEVSCTIPEHLYLPREAEGA